MNKINKNNELARRLVQFDFGAHTSKKNGTCVYTSSIHCIVLFNTQCYDLFNAERFFYFIDIV